MNLAQTETKGVQGEAERARREVEVLQCALKEREQALDALRIEVAGLKASFKQIDDAAVEERVEHQQANSHNLMQQHHHQQQQHQQQQQQQHADHQQQLRPVLGDAEHWLQGATIALASLPSPSPRKPDTHAASEAVTSHQQQQPANTRVFGAIINGNAGRRSAASKQPLNHAQQKQYQFGAWPLQQQQQQQQDCERNEHAVTWTAGGYSDGAAKKGRQQQSSRGKLVFLR